VLLPVTLPPSLQLTSADAAGFVVAHVAIEETLAGQHFCNRCGQPVDIGVVEHVDGGLVRV
jgi:hypothetical protein